MRTKSYNSNVLTLAGLLSFLGLWYACAALGVAPREFLPLPHEVLDTFFNLISTPFAGYTLVTHMLSSLERFFMGFVLAMLIGIPLGLLMGWSKTIDSIVSPLFDALRFIAPVAWVPFAALWFGTGIGGPTMIIFAGAFPPCLINAYRGVKNIDVKYVEAARMLGIGAFKTLTQVLFPAAVPSIIAGIRIGAGLGWMSLVGAELIVASSGMGYLIVKGQSAIATDIVMAGMLSIGAVGVVIDILIRRLEKWLLRYQSQ